MTELQRIRQNENRRLWRLKNKDHVKKKWREYAKNAREKNPEITKERVRKSVIKRKEQAKTKPLTYIVEIDNAITHEFLASYYKGMSEYEILNSLRNQYNGVILSNIPYTVWKVKPSRFDKVPHEDDETKNGTYFLINQ